MKLEVETVNMEKPGSEIVLGEMKTLVADYITEKGLRRMVKIKGGK